MTGKPLLNFPAFNAEADRLRALGYDVVNPAEINPDHSVPWATCMRDDIAQLVRCDGIVLLPGYESSRGACLELTIARALGLNVTYAGQIQRRAA